MPATPVADLSHIEPGGAPCVAFAVLQQVREGRTRNNEAFVDLGLGDTTANVRGKIWSDQSEAQEAARSLSAGLQKHARTLTFIFNTLVQDKSVDDRLRSYATPIDSRNLANEIEGASVASLLDACVGRYPLVARYYRLKARLLGLKRAATRG